MIGKVLIISDKDGHKFYKDIQIEWNKHGYEVYEKTFDEKEVFMRKLLIITLLLVLCFGLGGCKSHDKSQYDEVTNQRISFQQISFQIPKEWKKQDVTTDASTLVFAETKKDGETIGSLTVYEFADVRMSDEIYQIENVWELVKKQDDAVGEFTTKSISIADMPAKRIECAQKINGERVTHKIILLETSKGLIKMVSSSTSKVTQEVFDRVVDSIQKQERE